MSKKIGVVVPSNRPEELMKFKEAWAQCLNESEAALYVVEDQPSTWDDIKHNLGSDAWIIPVRTDCIRSYGYLMAYRDGCEYIVTLDDDVRPQSGNPILEHIKWLDTYVEPDNWTRTLKLGPPTRGLPLLRRVVLSHGLWDGVPDVSAKTQLEGFPPYVCSSQDDMIVPVGKFYPMSGMNLAWWAPFTRFMYFGLQGSDIREPTQRWGLDRCGDILAGVMSKVMVDAGQSSAIHSGSPVVRHDRASDPLKNLELEKAGEFVPYQYSVILGGSKTYPEMAERLFHADAPNKKYCRELGRAMRVWTELIKKG